MTFEAYCDIFNVGCITMKKKKKVFSFFDVIVIVVFTSIIMCFLGSALVYKHLGGVNFSLLGSDSNLQEFISAYNNLLDNYYDSLNSSDLIDGAIEGMYSKVDDPYTTYLDENSTSNLNDSLSGEYEGIGIKFGLNENEQPQVYEVYENTPASKAGVLVGDIFVSVNGTSVTNLTTTEIKDLIKKDSKNVTITVNREGTEHTFTMNIDTLYVPAISSYQIFQKNNKNVGYIRLKVFNDTADLQVSNTLSELENNGIDSLIIDLRDNSGGYLQVAKNIAEMFIEKSKIIYSLETKNGTTSYKDDTSEKRSYKVVVVMNKASASASEILAGALKYSYGATLLGVQSYGKGKVQEKANLTDGTTVKYTTAKWLTPNGDCIDEIGLTPDILVELDPNYNADDITTDNQVMSALSNLTN